MCHSSKWTWKQAYFKWLTVRWLYKNHLERFPMFPPTHHSNVNVWHLEHKEHSKRMHVTLLHINIHTCNSANKWWSNTNMNIGWHNGLLGATGPCMETFQWLWPLRSLCCWIRWVILFFPCLHFVSLRFFFSRTVWFEESLALAADVVVEVVLHPSYDSCPTSSSWVPMILLVISVGVVVWCGDVSVSVP